MNLFSTLRLGVSVLLGVSVSLTTLITYGQVPVLRVNSGHSEYINGLTATEDGALLFSWEKDTFFIWKADVSLLIETKRFDSNIQDVLVLNSHRKILIGTRTQLHILALDTFETLETIVRKEVHSMIHEPLLDTVYALEEHMLVQIDPTTNNIQRLHGYQQPISFADGTNPLYGFPATAELIPYNDALSIVMNNDTFTHYDNYALNFTAAFKKVQISDDSSGGVWTANAVASLDADHLLAGGIETFNKDGKAQNDYVVAVLKKEDFSVIARVTLREAIPDKTYYRYEIPLQSWSHPGEPIVVINHKSLQLLGWDGKTLTIQGTRSPVALTDCEETSISSLYPVSKQDGSFFAATTYSRPKEPKIERIPIIQQLRYASADTQSKGQIMGTFPLTPNAVAVHPTQDLFIVSNSKGTAKIVRWVNGSLKVESPPFQMKSPNVSGSGATLSWVGNYGQRWNLSSTMSPKHWSAPTMTGEQYSANRAPEQMALSHDGNLAATNFSGDLVVTDLRINRVIRNISRPQIKEFTQQTWSGVALSPDGKTVAYATKIEAPIMAGSSSLSWRFTVQAIDITTGKILWNHLSNSRPKALRYLGGATLLVLYERSMQVRRIDTVSGELIEYDDLTDSPNNQKEFMHEAVQAVAFGPSLDRGAYARDDLVGWFATSHNDSLTFLPRLGSTVLSLAFFNSERYLLIGTADGKVRLWNLDESRELAAMAFFELDEEWVMSTLDFRFDASPGGEKRMFFAKGTETIPLASLYENFHTPRLLDRLLDAQGLAPPIAPSLITTPPTVTVSTELKGEEVTVTMDATSSTGPISEIRLYHNGKLVTAQQRGLFVEDDELAPDNTTEHTLHRVANLPLLEGTNEYRAIALNAQRTESAPAIAEIDGPTFESRGGFKLHLLAIGIDIYDNPKLSLNYARADATAFAKIIESQTKGLFSQPTVTLLLDGEATRNRILSELDKIAKSSKPRDVVIVYYAGHGAMSGSNSPEFYLIPPDVTQLYGNDSLLKERAISAAELRDLAAKIPAQKQLFILDACQSAGALQTVAMRGAAQEKAIAQLARSTGTYWLTATGTEQFAAEFEALGHGAFTYSIIEGIEAGQGDINNDGQVTVRELDTYLQSRVPELTREQRGTSQHPASFGYGQDFPLIITSRSRN